MKWFIKCMRHYTDFKGRARPKEYWMFVLFTCMIMYVILFFAMCSGGIPSGIEILSVSHDPFDMYGYFFSHIWYYYAVGLVFFLPGLAVMVRRLHDTGRSGWMLGLYGLIYAVILLCYIVLLYFITRFSVQIETPGNMVGGELVGFLFWVGSLYGMLFRGFAFSVAFLVWLCLPGERGTNKYGPDPKTVSE